MADKTKIEWTDSTWSPLRVRVRMDAPAIAKAKGYGSLVEISMKMRGRAGQHCEHVSPGCQHCYAETNNHRCLPANGTGLPYDRRSRDLVEAFVDGKALMAPFKWRPVFDTKEPHPNSVIVLKGMPVKALQRPRRIFVENQSDLFGEWVPDEMIDQVFAVMALCQQHTFQVLTKRPERMLAYCSNDALLARLAQATDGVAKAFGGRAVVESRQYDDGLTGVTLPNVWLGVSCENQETADERIPLLLKTPAAVRFISAEPLLGRIEFKLVPGFNRIGLDLSKWWVICGGESGPGARPMHPDWARSLRDQCTSAGVPFFFKQWGEFLPGAGPDPRKEIPIHCSTDGLMHRVGKKAAGALLDGVEWKQFPEASA